jgi:hypothetical protein
MSNSGAEPDEWRDTMEKFKDGIDAAKATKDELGDYIETRIHVYTRDNFKDYTLWGIYLEDFQGWTMEDFRRARTNAKSKLCALLLQRGVYVARHSNRYPLAKSSLMSYKRRNLINGQMKRSPGTSRRLAP